MPRSATQGQIDYLTTLFVDCGFTLLERKAFLQKRFERQIRFLDQLDVQEASEAIKELKLQKENNVYLPERPNRNT